MKNTVSYQDFEPMLALENARIQESERVSRLRQCKTGSAAFCPYRVMTLAYWRWYA
jgi:hypothetical protein